MDRKEPMVREFMTAVQNVTGREPGISYFGSIGDFCYLVTRLKAPAVIFGADGRNYHSKDEYVLLDSVHQTAPMFLSRAWKRARSRALRMMMLECNSPARLKVLLVEMQMMSRS